MPDASGYTMKDEPAAEPWPDPDTSVLRAEAAPAAMFPTGVLPPFWARWAAEAAEAAGAVAPTTSLARYWPLPGRCWAMRLGDRLGRAGASRPPSWSR